MLLNGIDVTGDEVSESFAGFFDKKVVGIVDSVGYREHSNSAALQSMFQI